MENSGGRKHCVLNEHRNFSKPKKRPLLIGGSSHLIIIPGYFYKMTKETNATKNYKREFYNIMAPE